MKKNYLRLITILILLSSCENSSDKKKVTIDNFNEKFVDSLIPVPDKNYSVCYVKIEGNSNDTIRLNLSSNNPQIPSSDYYFIGDFEEEIRLDYYGESNQYVTFDPYKATKGKIKLIYRL
ncbi:MAG: hypothetical protein ABJ092_11915 [Gillisia sp.]